MLYSVNKKVGSVHLVLVVDSVWAVPSGISVKQGVTPAAVPDAVAFAISVLEASIPSKKVVA